jgi:hypothetical protein
MLICAPFHHGLVFSMAMGLLVIAAIVSAFRGGRHVHDEHGAPAAEIPAAAPQDTPAAFPPNGTASADTAPQETASAHGAGGQRRLALRVPAAQAGD